MKAQAKNCRVEQPGALAYEKVRPKKINVKTK